MINNKILFLAGISIVLSCSSSFASIVLDPANLIQNTNTAVRTLQMMQDTTKSLKNLKNMNVEISSLHQLDLLNLEKLSNINQLIQDTNNTVDDSYGNSVTSQLTVLDPDSGDYSDQRDKILNQYYEKPSDPNEIQASFQRELNPEQIEVMKNEAKLQRSDYHALQIAADEAAKEQKKARKRQEAIRKNSDTIKNLGEKSELKTQQVMASEINLELQQNEQLIQQQNEALMYAKMQKAEEASEKAKESKFEQDRLKKAMNQKTTGLGSDKWGDL